MQNMSNQKNNSIISCINNTNVFALVSAFALLAQEVQAYTNYCTINGCWTSYDWYDNCDICSSYYYGTIRYYCCDYWYSTAWAVALFVILGLILVACLICCCVAYRQPTYYDDGVIVAQRKPEVVVISTNTQPAQTVTAQPGQTTVMPAGQYEMQSMQATTAPFQPAPVYQQQPAPVNGVPMGGPVMQGTPVDVGSPSRNMNQSLNNNNNNNHYRNSGGANYPSVAPPTTYV